MMSNNIVSKKITITLFIAMLSIAFFSCVHVEVQKNVTYKGDYNPISIEMPQENQEYKILQLADTQLDKCTDDYLLEKFEVLSKVINSAKPDLIVLTGDNSAGKKGKDVLARLIPFLDSFEIPYASVFGNHDAEGGSPKSLAAIYLKGKYSLFKEGPSSIHGVGNYQINLSQNDQVKYSFYMLDSNRYRSYTASQKKNSELGGTKYDYIYPDQIAWYAYSVNKTTELNNGVIPSLAFFHIAIPEFRHYKDAADEDILIKQKNKGETVCNGFVNTGFFAEMKKLGSTKGAFVGHDHINNYVFKYQDIILGYGLKSGETSYFDKELQGGTLITLKNNFQDIEVKHLYKSDLQ